MKIIQTSTELQHAIAKLKLDGLTVGLVPTMGFLHNGHLSLIEACKKQCDVCIVSIYVNPSQFNESADFESYPKDLNRDIELLNSVKCDLVWVPTAADIESVPLDLSYKLDGVDAVLEGEKRPGHFKGVIEVVYRLFKVVNPDQAYFGEKDFQQLQVISKMVKNNKMNIHVIPVPTTRELDGLAMSSRNVRLSSKERVIAPELHALLKKLSSNAGRNFDHAKELLVEKGFEVEYLTQHDFSDGGERLFAAVKLGSVRLIDNVPLRAILN
ncbi:MAG: pantoate--beta-alanine ligase [Glaciecola sp.]|jgi:pantoate--beta-alanine ligase